MVVTIPKEALPEVAIAALKEASWKGMLTDDLVRTCAEIVEIGEEGRKGRWEPS